MTAPTGIVDQATIAKLNELASTSATPAVPAQPISKTGTSTIPAIPAIPSRLATTTAITTIPTIPTTTTTIPAIPAIPAEPTPGANTSATPATPAVPVVPATPIQSSSTPPQDITPPIISNIQTTNITEISATITWTTNESSDSQVSYGLTSSYDNTTPLNSSLVVSHSVSLSNLTGGTTYHYKVISTDNSGNKTESADTTFTTTYSVQPAPSFLMKWGSYGSGDGQFYGPYGIAVDASGNVYVTDSGNNRVQKFTSNGTFITKWGSQGSEDGQFSGPDGIAVDANGNVYVVDRSNHRIQKFAPAVAVNETLTLSQMANILDAMKSTLDELIKILK